jgi:hypothetical protein
MEDLARGVDVGVWVGAVLARGARSRVREARAPAIGAELGEIVEATLAAQPAVAVAMSRDLGSTGAVRKGLGG